MTTKVKILVVEDENVTALDISRKLEEMGYTVTGIVDSAKKVIDEVEKKRPDLALLDIKLKGRYDGIQTAERLRKDYNIPVIFLTAYADVETVKRAIKTSPYGYIVKPVDELELHTSIEVALHKYRVETKLRESEERYRTLQANIPVGVFRTTPGGEFLSANATLAEMLGYDMVEDLIDAPVSDLYATPEGRQEFTKKIEEEGVVADFETQLKRKDGMVFWVSLNSRAVLDETGEIAYYDGIVEDITDRKRAEEALVASEEKFRLTFENAKDAIFWADTETGLMIECNKAAETMLGKERGEIIGHHQSEVHPPQKADYYTEMFQQHIERKGAVDVEAEVITRSGKITPVHISASLTLVGEEPIIQGIFRDVTERKLAEEAMAELRRAKDTLTDLVVHDIKNISSAMLAWLEILNEGVLGDLTREQHNALRRVIECNEELFGLSEEMLDIASVEDGKFYLNKKTYVFEDQVREVVEQHRPTALNEKKNIKFRQSGSPILVLADEYRVRRGISNLVLNAIKFVAPDIGKIYVSVRSDEDSGFAVLRVSDNGPGIPKQYHEKIFEKFGQVELNAKGVKKGKGLGLTFCKMITEAHGGDITVESDGESGSTFIFKLPLYNLEE